MPIIISDEEGTRKIEESKFERESKLQEYIYDNPEVLPIEEIEDEIPFIIVAREVPTNSGPIDAVGLDVNGNIYVIETKLYNNSDKRKVIAQALDYGAALWKHTNDFGEFMRNLRDHYRDKFDQELDDNLLSSFDIEEDNLDEYFDNVKQNLDDGKYRFVILMDRVDSRLKDLILFMNQNSRFDIYSVELDYYKFDGYHLSIPKLYGTEVKKSVGSRTSSGRSTWDEESFFEDLEEKVDELDYNKIKKIYQQTKDLGEISFGTGSRNGSITLKVKSKDDGRKVSVYSLKSNGKARLFSGHPLKPKDRRKQLIEKYVVNLREDNPDLPKFVENKWTANIGKVKEDQIDDFIQFYREITEKIKNLEVE